MTKKANDGRVTGNSCVVFCDNRGTLRYGVFQFSGPIVAVHVSAEPVAVFEICFGRLPDDMTLDRNTEAAPLHAYQMFADVIPKLGIQRE